MSVVPPCAGKWALFDSTDIRDHHEARTLCHTCPAVAACLTALRTARADALAGDKYGPAGTWAGQLLGVTRQTRAAAEEAMFGEDDARAAHARYAAGSRDPKDATGERVYQRRKKRQQLARKAAA
jgi:hypothetical protein